MRKLLLFLSFVSLGVFLYFGLKAIDESKALNAQAEILSQDIDKIKGKLDLLANYLHKDPKALGDEYYGFYNQLNNIAAYTNTECNITLAGSKENVDIKNYFKDSDLKGVKALNLEINFIKVNDHDVSIFILESMNSLRDVFPVEITHLTKNQDKMTVFLNLYGI